MDEPYRGGFAMPVRRFVTPKVRPVASRICGALEGIAEAVFDRLLNRIANPMLSTAEVHLDAALVERDSVRRRRQ